MKKRFIDPAEESVGRYLKEIRTKEVMPEHEQMILLKEAQNGNTRSEEKLIKSFLGLVVTIANTFSGMGSFLNDLINEGNIALIEAIRKYDHKLPLKTYIAHQVRNAVLETINSNNCIRIPRGRVWLSRALNKASMKLEKELGYIPCAEDLAEATGKSEVTVKSILADSYRTVSLDQPVSQDEDSCLLADTIADNNCTPTDYNAEQKGLTRTIERSLVTLKKRERVTVRLLYGIGVDYSMEVEDIARMLNMTKDMVRYFGDKAINAIKGKTGDQLQTYLC
jgi:RNA polymerase sigma factor (sigma-70 family)